MARVYRHFFGGLAHGDVLPVPEDKTLWTVRGKRKGSLDHFFETGDGLVPVEYFDEDYTLRKVSHPRHGAREIMVLASMSDDELCSKLNAYEEQFYNSQ